MSHVSADLGPDRLNKPVHYMPQLDALRALAVLSVMWAHWIDPRFPSGLPLGSAGVQLFFVLSGFLITGILLRAREGAAEAGERGHVLKGFFARRFLRIFPLYYAVIMIGVLAGAPMFRETAGWSVTYTLNFKIFMEQDWLSPLAHFWSLAVEEQFYLFWPWLMVFVPRRWLVRVIVGMMGVAWASRVVAAVVWPEVGYVDVLPWVNLDALGGGALLAYLGPATAKGRRLTRWCGWVGVPAFLVLAGLIATWRGGDDGDWGMLADLRHAAMIVAFIWLIGAAARGFGGVAGRVLENPVLISLGTVSYGLYVLHNFAPHALNAASRWYTGEAMGIQYRVPLSLVLTIAVAYASWYGFEKPINRLKTRFPYRPRRRPAEGPVLGDATRAVPQRKGVDEGRDVEESYSDARP